jgi:hypothetical protein
VSPPPEFNPPPVKRKKFRDMLMRNGGLIGSEQEEVFLASIASMRDTMGGRDTRRRDMRGREGSPKLRTRGRDGEGEKGVGVGVLIDMEEQSDEEPATNIFVSASHELFLSPLTPLSTAMQTPILPSSFLSTPLRSISSSPALSSSPAISASPISTSPAPSTELTPYVNLPKVVIVSTLVDMSEPQDTDLSSLLDLTTPPFGALGDLVGLSMEFKVLTLDSELDGLDFQHILNPARFEEVQGHVEDNILFAEATLEIPTDMTTNTTPEATTEMTPATILTISSETPELISITDEVVFQPRRRDPSTVKPVDDLAADRAFRMFSIGVKQHK